MKTKTIMMLLAVMVCQPCAHLLAFSANERAVDMTANLMSGSDEPVELNGIKRSRRIMRDISMYECDGFIHVDSYKAYESYTAANMSDEDLLLAENIEANL